MPHIPLNHEIQNEAERKELADVVKSFPKESTLSTVDRLRRIVETRTAGRIKGELVDTFSARMMLTVYEALSPEKQVKFEGMSVRRMMQLACKVL
jgi:hypothetical protein